MSRRVNHRFCPLLIQLNADGKHVWHSTPSPVATRLVRRLRHSIESWIDDLDFAQWLFALCITATVLLIKRRLRSTVVTLIRLFFGW
jgi:hypothetical protein